MQGWRWKVLAVLVLALSVWQLFVFELAAAAGKHDSERQEKLERMERAARFIMRQQDEQGAIVESGYINTDSNMLYALMGLISAYDLTRDVRYLRAVENGMRWLMRVQTPQGDWHLAYRRAGDGYVPAVPGSYRHFSAIRGIDTTMALFIYVARDVDRRTDQPELRKQLRQAAKSAYQFLVVHNLDPADGLYWSSYQLAAGKTARSIADYQRYPVKYAADNAETYVGLVAAAALFPDTEAERLGRRLKDHFGKFFVAAEGQYTVMVNEEGEQSPRPAYARWFANGWSASLFRDSSMFAKPLAAMAAHLDERGAFRQREGTFTLSTLAYLLGAQACHPDFPGKRLAERYLYARQLPNGGLADSAEASSTYVNLAGMWILYLSRELQG